MAHCFELLAYVMLIKTVVICSFFVIRGTDSESLSLVVVA